MKVELNIEGNELTPTLEKLLESMSDEDKSKMVREIAMTYFCKKMDSDQDFSSFRSESKGEALLGQLVSKTRDTLSEEILKDERLRGILEEHVRAIAPAIPEIVDAAIKGAFATLIKGAFETQLQTSTSLVNLVARLKSEMPSIDLSQLNDY